jgi:hypothetical protein
MGGAMSGGRGVFHVSGLRAGRRRISRTIALSVFLVGSTRAQVRETTVNVLCPKCTVENDDETIRWSKSSIPRMAEVIGSQRFSQYMHYIPDDRHLG